jgi:hypothetical protein
VLAQQPGKIEIFSQIDSTLGPGIADTAIDRTCAGKARDQRCVTAVYCELRSDPILPLFQPATNIQTQGSDLMERPNLRVYFGPDDSTTATLDEESPEKSTIDVTLGEIFPLLADAVRGGRTWLDDFANDEISISNDLYEVILAYQHFRRPSA